MAIQVKGMERIVSNLHQISPAYNRRSNRKALELSMRQMRKALKAATPRQSKEEILRKGKASRNQMYDNLKTKAKTYSNGNVFGGIGFEYNKEVEMGLKKGARHAHLPTKGFGKFTHLSHPPHGKIMKFPNPMNGNKYTWTRRIKHPGYKGKNYMYPIMIQNANRLQETFFRAYRAHLLRRINQLPKGK